MCEPEYATVLNYCDESLDDFHRSSLEEDPAIQAYTPSHLRWVEEPEDHRY